MSTTKTPQLLQIQVQERNAKATVLKVKLTTELLNDLQEIQGVLSNNPLIPVPSIHSMILKAVGNYVKDFNKSNYKKECV